MIASGSGSRGTFQVTYPAIEGGWRLESNGGSGDQTLRITGDKWLVEAVAVFGTAHCEGTVSRGPDDTYLFTTTEGVCDTRGIATLEEDGRTLVVKSDSGNSSDRFTRE
jgi:hypothetical protein